MRLPAITAISAGDHHSLALDSTGTVWAWGRNWQGELGTGTATRTGCRCIATPGAVRLPAGTAVTAISAGGLFSLALAPPSAH
jgi:alpha-tubulin suppressor-like RCC1 family protein